MSSGDTLEQLRADIDSGRTGDKVSAPDPAMAPLGTDDEAAGTPPSPAAIALTRRIETSHPTPTSAANRTGPRVDFDRVRHRFSSSYRGLGFPSGNTLTC
jgi:hypothetical protein